MTSMSNHRSPRHSLLAAWRRADTKRDQGFTLIELLVVIIIIGILAAIAIPVFLNQRKKGINASMKADLKAMAVAQETCIVDNPSIPGISLSVPAGQTRTVCGSGSSAVTFTASPGNEILAYAHDHGTPDSSYPGSYCLIAYNPNSSASSKNGAGVTIENRYYYNGLNGGGFTTWC